MNSNRSARSGRSAHTFYSAKTMHRSLGDTETNELSRGELMRMNSVFSKQSIANVRLEDAAARLDMKSSLTIWIIIMTAAMTYTLHGFSNSITNGIITDGTFRHQFPQTDTVDTEGKQNSQNSTIQGIMVGLYQVGCAVGAFMCYFCSDRLGRKPVIHILGVTSCIGIILQCSAFSLPHLIIGRVVMGLGVGAGHATFPLYLAECVPSRIRGRAIIACAVGGNFGHFLGAIVEIAFYFVKKSPQWRIPLALELIWALSSATLPFWCPESPRYLLRKREVEKCITVQSKIFGLSENDPKVKEEVNAMEAALYEAGACDGNDDKKPARLWYRVFLGMFIQIMSSMSGIDVVSFFSTQTFQQQLHFSPLISRILTMGLQACQWLWSILSIFAIDSLGRRVLLLFCAALMATAMGCLFGLTIPSASAQMLKAALLFYFFTMCAYPVGYHLIPSMYVAEISPGNVRHEVAALSGCLHFLFDFLVTLITPIAFAAIGSRYYCVYLATNAVTFLVVYFLFIETKGVELETIEEIFEFSPSCLALVRFGNERATIAKELRVDCPPIPEDYPTDESSENQQT